MTVLLAFIKNYKFMKFSLQSHLTYINTKFECCNAFVNLDNVNVLNFEDGNV